MKQQCSIDQDSRVEERHWRLHHNIEKVFEHLARRPKSREDEQQQPAKGAEDCTEVHGRVDAQVEEGWMQIGR